MKNLPKGQIFNIENTIPTKKNHTISKSIFNTKDFDGVLFSLAEGTDISKEFYEDLSIFYVLKGNIKILNENISAGNIYITKKDKLRGVESCQDSVYIELIDKGDNKMKNINKSEIINLKDSIDYVEGGISNLDIISKDNVKFMLMAFDEGEELSSHSAPGDAMVIALEGSAKLTVGDKTHIIKAGEELIFPKNINHNVEAIGKFKMALLLVMDN